MAKYLIAALAVFMTIFNPSTAMSYDIIVEEELPLNPHTVRVIDGTIIEIVFTEGEDGWSVPAEYIEQMCSTGRIFLLDRVPLAERLRIYIAGGHFHAGGLSVGYYCPLPSELQWLRDRMAEAMVVNYRWTDEIQTAVLTALDERRVRTETITVGTSGLPWYGPLLTSPYAPRWSEGNFASHLRDERPDREVEVVVITTADRRYTVLLDGCDGIEKVAVGVLPTATVRRQAHPTPPRMAQPPTVSTPRPAPGAGVEMLCTRC